MNNHLPSSELIIRPASFTDIDAIRNIAYETWPHAYNTVIGNDQVNYMLEKFYSTASLEQQMKDQHYFFLALKDYKPIGFASFSKIEEGVFKLQKLYVLPSLQKTGAGKALLNTVETVAKSMDAQKLQLNVNRKNPAKIFYEKNRFKIIEEVDIDIDNGFFMNDYIMEKEF